MSLWVRVCLSRNYNKANFTKTASRDPKLTVRPLPDVETAAAPSLECCEALGEVTKGGCLCAPARPSHITTHLSAARLGSAMARGLPSSSYYIGHQLLVIFQELRRPFRGMTGLVLDWAGRPLINSRSGAPSAELS